MPTRQIHLSARDDDFIEKQVACGRFPDASEVMRAGLALLELQEREGALQMEQLRCEIKKGMEDYEAGRYTSVRNQTEHIALMDQLEREAEAECRHDGQAF
jgi:antitoxin ParD1/3/4